MSSARSVDLRLAVPAASAWVGAAVAQGVGVGTARAAVVLLAGVAALGLARQRHCPAVVVAAVAVGAAAGVAVMATHRAALERGPVAALARQHATVDLNLRLVRDPVAVTSRAGRRLTVVDATVTAVRAARGSWMADTAPVTVFAMWGRWQGLLPGQRVVVTAALRAPRGSDAVAAVAFARGEPRPVGRPPWWQRWAGRVRDALRTACNGLPADERGLVPGLVLGDVTAMPADLTDAFRATGLSHLNAVSGANVAIVLGAVAAAVRHLGIGRRARAMSAAAALAGFVVLVRPSPSVLRAAAMGAVVLAAALLGRRTSPVPVLAAAVLALVLVDPFLARSPGFAMSVLATFAIVVVAPRWTDRLAARMPRPLAAAVAVPAAAQVACTPVIVAVFGQLSPLAVPANLLAAPAVAPATLAGVGCALVAPFAPWAARPFAWVAGAATGWIAAVARTLAALPGAGLSAPRGRVGLALLLGVGAAAVVAVRIRRQRRDRGMLDACPP